MFLLVLLVLVLFFIVAYNSNMFESRRVIETRGGVEYIKVENQIHWDRFLEYIFSIPEKMSAKIRAKFFSKFEVS